MVVVIRIGFNSIMDSYINLYILMEYKLNIVFGWF